MFFYYKITHANNLCYVLFSKKFLFPAGKKLTNEESNLVLVQVQDFGEFNVKDTCVPKYTR